MTIGMRDRVKRELSRVMERGLQVDYKLQSKCAYYPLFRYVRFVNDDGEVIQGQQFMCKECSIYFPNKRCKHHTILMW